MVRVGLKRTFEGEAGNGLLPHEHQAVVEQVETPGSILSLEPEAVAGQPGDSSRTPVQSVHTPVIGVEGEERVPVVHSHQLFPAA